MACLKNLISQPSLDISPVWISLISNEVINPQRRTVRRNRFFMGFYEVLVSRFYSTDSVSGRHCMFSQILHLTVCIGAHGLGLLARFVAQLLSAFLS
jgi:hypothetical protein